MKDVAYRLVERGQLTTDGNNRYLEAVDKAFGDMQVDFAQLQKIYGTEGSSGRYSPPECKGTKKIKVTGAPELEHISTSCIERQNLTMRMGMRRFARLTNGFSKKMENHCLAIALHFVYYNFVRVHKTLRVTPAIEAGLTKKPMTLEELVQLPTGQD
jgi:hypothetical protein